MRLRCRCHVATAAAAPPRRRIGLAHRPRRVPDAPEDARRPHSPRPHPLQRLPHARLHLQDWRLRPLARDGGGPAPRHLRRRLRLRATQQWWCWWWCCWCCCCCCCCYWCCCWCGLESAGIGIVSESTGTPRGRPTGGRARQRRAREWAREWATAAARRRAQPPRQRDAWRGHDALHVPRAARTAAL